MLPPVSAFRRKNYQQSIPTLTIMPDFNTDSLREILLATSVADWSSRFQFCCRDSRIFISSKYVECSMTLSAICIRDNWLSQNQYVSVLIIRVNAGQRSKFFSYAWCRYNHLHVYVNTVKHVLSNHPWSDRSVWGDGLFEQVIVAAGLTWVTSTNRMFLRWSGKNMPNTNNTNLEGPSFAVF